MRWDPLQDLVSWHERLRRAPSGATGWAPPVDVFETADSYSLVVELAGLSASDFSVTATEEQVTVSGQRSGGVGDGRFIHVERGHGGFTRTFAFAHRVDARGVRADFKDGLLTVTIPKLPLPDVHRVDVGVTGS